MKVFLPHNQLERTSGIGKAVTKQIEYLQNENIECCFHKQKGIDLVHINSVFDPKNLFVLFETHKKRIPLITHGHSTKQDYLNSFWFANITKKIVYYKYKKYYSYADLIITPTEYSKSLLLGYGYNDNIVVVSNGIDVDLSNANIEQNIELFLKSCNLSKDDKVVLGIGHPFLRKGIDDFFACAKKFPAYKFVWCGHVPSVLLPKEVRTLLRNKPKNVILPGFINPLAVRGGMHFSKCFFFPSREETEGIVVLEALSCRCPLIVRDIGVYDYWLKNNLNCKKAIDRQGFERALYEVLNQNTTQMVEEGYKVAKSKDRSRISKELSNAYNKTIYDAANKKSDINRKVR